MINKTLGNIFKGDKVIWMVFFFLCMISIVEVYSASSSLTYKSGQYALPIIKHSGFLLLGLLAMVVTLNIKCKYFKILTPFLLFLSVVLLLWALIAGHNANDASRWVDILGFRFQPSEIAKGTLVLTVAQILSATQTDKGADKRAFTYILVVCAIIIPLIALENLSTGMLLALTVLLMMIVGRVPARQIGQLIGASTIVIVGVVAFVLLVGKESTPANSRQELTEQVSGEEERNAAAEEGPLSKLLHRADTWKARMLKFLDEKPVKPEDVDIMDKDMQVAHANIAIASSNYIGKGPGNSDERDFLSQAFSDFIYAIIIEEMGIGGAAFVALLYVILLFRAGRIANRCENNFPAFLTMGLCIMLVTQALFNMMVAVGLAPVTGQPLPLISRGGTSSILNCVYIGVILSVSRSAKKREGIQSPSISRENGNIAKGMEKIL